MVIRVYKKENKKDTYNVVFTKVFDEWSYDMKLINESSYIIHIIIRFDIRMWVERKLAAYKLWQWKQYLDIRNVVWGNHEKQHYHIETYIEKNAQCNISRFIKTFVDEYNNYESNGIQQ